MKFSIDSSGKIYDIGAIDRLRLVDLILMQEQTKALGREITMADVQVMKDNLAELEPEERAAHVDQLWIVAIGIFAARRIAGDNIGFEEAISFPITALKWLPEPSDRQAPTPDPTRARQGSGRAAKRAAPSPRKTATSAAPSTAASS